MDDRPASHRRRLRRELRRVREMAGHTREHVAQAMEWSLSKLVRIETGTVNISVSDLRSLLEFYGLGEVERQQLIRLCRLGRRRMWWDDLQVVGQPLQRYIALESEASRICQYDPLLVPGLLQTESYIRSVITSVGLDEPTRQQVETWLSVRLRRQREVLHRPSPAEIVAVIDEGALHRLVGGAEVMRDQRRHLVRLARQGNVAIHVLPFEIGSYPAIDRPFTILEFEGDELDDFLFFTGSSHAFIEEATEKVILYRRTMERLRALALNESESIELMIKLAAG